MKWIKKAEGEDEDLKRRKLFCEISPLTYKISVMKCKFLRYISDIPNYCSIAGEKSAEPLPVLIYSHKSLIRRRLGDVDPLLQDNKAVNLSIAAPKVSGVLIRPKQVFSFWTLVGSTSEKKGYRRGLVINRGKTGSDIGGGMCQFTNLIHWLILHSPMRITEHHHHDGIDLFPDFNRQVPFGVGTSIVHNYLDYRFKNITEHTFQLIIYTTDKYLCGELRSDKPLDYAYHIKVTEEYFSEEQDGWYRNNKVYRDCIDKRTGITLSSEMIKSSHAKVMYDPVYINRISKTPLPAPNAR